MKMRLTYLLIIGVASLGIITESFGQSGWTRSHQGYFVQLSGSVFTSDTFYDLQAERNQLSEAFSSENVLLYGEYGVSDRATLLFNMPMYKWQRFDNTETSTGAGDIRVGLKYRLLERIPISVSVEAEIPTGSDEQFVNYTEPNVNEPLINLPVSDAEYNYWVTFAGSKSNATGTLYGSLYTAINFRTRDYTNQLQIGGEIGRKFNDKFWLIGKVKIQEPLQDSDIGATFFLFEEQTKYTQFGLTAFYDITDQLSLTATYLGYNDWLQDLQNVSLGPTFILGVAIQR